MTLTDASTGDFPPPPPPPATISYEGKSGKNPLGLAGDLGELGFCCSAAVGSRSWWSSLVVIGRC
ncbi:hypothetical protein ACWET9_48130 [Streptomyces sp. NPDC004059]